MTATERILVSLILLPTVAFAQRGGGSGGGMLREKLGGRGGG